MWNRDYRSASEAIANQNGANLHYCALMRFFRCDWITRICGFADAFSRRATPVAQERDPTVRSNPFRTCSAGIAFLHRRITSDHADTVTFRHDGQGLGAVDRGLKSFEFFLVRLDFEGFDCVFDIMRFRAPMIGEFTPGFIQDPGERDLSVPYLSFLRDFGYRSTT